MSNLLNKPNVLRLNAFWQPLGWSTVQEAIKSLCGMPGGTDPAIVLDIEMTAGDIKIHPTKWEDWIKLPIRKGDAAISTSSGAIRCPTVIVDPNFKDIPLKTPKLTSRAILERDNFIDQYTGEKLKEHEANVDHVISRDVWRKCGLKGNPNCWENMVCCHKDRNFRKGNKSKSAMGLSLIRKPKAPKPVPVSFLIGAARHPDQRPFIKSQK